ncbi:MAG: hypothetical protein OQJ89_03330, partial [Kangiellaceae bacterium]|nr:hypothetical protein [Kangiellaceae bacterium]
MLGFFKKRNTVKQYEKLELINDLPELPSSVEYSSFFKKDEPFLYFNRKKVKQAFDSFNEEQLADSIYESIQSR